MTIGDKIKRIRTERGMTQDAVANSLDISRQAVARWESNQSSPSTLNLIKLSELFQVDIKDLVSNEEYSIEDLHNSVNELLQSEERRQDRNHLIKHLIKHCVIIFGSFLVVYVVYWLCFREFGIQNYIVPWVFDNHVLPLTCVIAILLSVLCWDKWGFFVFAGTLVGLILGDIVGRISWKSEAPRFNNGWIALLISICVFSIVGMIVACIKHKKNEATSALSRFVKPQKTILVLSMCFVMLFTAFVVFRSVNRLSFNRGAKYGYKSGYEQGQADKESGLDSRQLSEDCFPESMVFGTPEYSGFAIYWPAGYMEGYEGK